MSLATVVVVGLLTLLAAVVVIGMAVRALRIVRNVHGARVVTCPETGHPAGVAIDVRHAVTSGFFGGAGRAFLGWRPPAPDIRLRGCSRWSTRGRCDERCVWEAAEAGSTTRAIVERALIGKPCAFCGKRLERVAFLDHYAALLQPDRTTIEWPEIPAEHMRESLMTQPPVCWDCHVAETFRRQYPELVTDRPWRRA
jgi:hypothetical protein